MPRVFRRRDKRGKPTGPWIAWWYIVRGTERVRQQRSTGQTDERAAEAIVREWERDQADPRRAPVPRAALADALQLLINTRAEQAEAGTRALATVGFYVTKRLAIEHVLGPTLPLADLTAKRVDAFVSARRGAGASEHTIHKELVTLRTALKLAARAGLCSLEVLAALPVGFSTGYKPRKRHLSVAEVRALCEAFVATDQHDKAARVAFMAATGARWSECNSALRTGIDKGAGMVHLRGTKTAGADRVVPVVGASAPWLTYALKHAQGKAPALFTPWPHNVHRDLAAACARAEIPVCTPNDLRRTFATWLRAGGAAPDLIAPAMGHKTDVMVQMVYGQLAPEVLRKQLLGSLRSASKSSNSAAAPAVGQIKRGKSTQKRKTK